MSHTPSSVVIVGAGLAGLVAGRTLADAGIDVTLVDKGRSVGGRLATRRIGESRLDHGAQFFTVRSPEMQAFVDPLVDAGLVYEWCQGFNEIDGFPRYAAQGGMNALAKHLAQGLDARLDVELDAITASEVGWRCSADERAFEAEAAIVTPPVPQSVALLERGGIEVPPGIEEITYFTTLAPLVILDGPSGVPEPGGRQLSEGSFTFVADNHMKGVSDTTAITLHVDHDVSDERFDDDSDEVLADLIDAARTEGWLGSATVVDAQLKKWRYAGPRQPWPDPYCPVDEAATLLLAGDAFGGPKVEGVYRSGLAAAHALLTRDQ